MSKPGKNRIHIEARAEPRVEIDSEVTRCIRQHARSHIKTEVCGVLIGEKTDTAIDIRFSIEASSAAQGGTHVTFTQEAWEEIYRVKDQKYPEERIVGWYHSHPGFGVFLSEHDLFIQQNFFSSPDQVAWVYDPHTDEEGCYGWVGGEVHRLSSLSIADRNGDGVERTPKRAESALDLHDGDESLGESYGDLRGPRKEALPPWMRWSVMAFGYLSVLVLGFAISYFLLPQIVIVEPYQDPATGQIGWREAPELRPYFEESLRHQQPEPQAQPSSPAPVPSPGASTSPLTPAAPAASAVRPAPALPSTQPTTSGSKP